MNPNSGTAWKGLLFATFMLLAHAVYADASSPAPELDVTSPTPELKGFSADFEVSYLAFNADAQLRLSATENQQEFLYEVATTARGLAKLVRSGTATEQARFLLTDAGLVPQTYQLDDGGKNNENDTTINFDWAAGVANSIYEGQPASIEITRGIYDRLSADIVAILDIRNGVNPGPYQIAERNQIRPYEFMDQGEETVTVPAGTFKAKKYLRQRPGSSRSTMVWYAIDAGYLPVRIEQLKRGKTTITMVATRLQPEI